MQKYNLFSDQTKRRFWKISKTTSKRKIVRLEFKLSLQKSI